MNSQTKVCQNCHSDFTIEPDDFQFYEKMKVPPPTFCANCRLQRRMTWRNERSLYKRKCDLCEKNILSIYSQENPFTVYCPKCWWSDGWNPLEYGQKYDFSKPFFGQFYNLLTKIPLLSLINLNAVNSDYVNYTTDSKNCYLLFASGAKAPNEDCFYSYRMDGCKNCVDNSFTVQSENCYQLIDADNCNRVFWSRYANGSYDSYFLFNCRNCQNCFGGINLRNKTNIIFNKQYSKEDFNKEIIGFNTGSFLNYQKYQNLFNELKQQFFCKYAEIEKSVNCSGDNIYNSKNCRQCFYIKNSENSKYIFHSPAGVKDSYDTDQGGGELLYENSTAISNSSDINFSALSSNCAKTSYSYWTTGSSNIFACIGLRNKEYCILNKQYTKEQYEELVPKIINHMNEMPYTDKKGRIYKYGEFFPSELSPFAYNETIAQEYFPLTKEQAETQGFSWKDREDKNYQITKNPEDLPDRIKDAEDSILNDIIGCEHQAKCNEQCTKAFKIIPQELQFYKRMNLPLPRLCPNCRHYQRLKQRNPLKLWHRRCMCNGETSDKGQETGIIYKNTISHFHGQDHCPNEFETSYAPERKEIVYCEQCYQAEVV